MDPIVLDVQLTPTDWDAHQLYITRRFAERFTPWREHVRGMLLTAAVVVLGLLILTFLRRGIEPFSVVAGLLIGIVAMVGVGRRRLRLMRPDASSQRYAPMRYTLNAAGIRTERQHQSAFYAWTSIEQIEETAEHVFLTVDRLSAHVIPKRCLTSITSEAFVEQVRQWHAAGRAPNVTQPLDAAADAASAPQMEASVVALAPTTSLAAPSAGPAATPLRSFWRALRANLTLGMRIFFFRPVQPSDITSTFDQVAGLLAILLLVAVTLDRVTAGGDVQFTYYGLYSWCTFLLLGMWICAAIARSLSGKADTRVVLIAALATAPWAVLLASLLSYVPLLSDNPTLFGGAVAVIALWTALRAARAAYGFLRLGTLGVIVLSIFGVMFASSYFAELHLWTEVADDADSSAQTQSWQNAESIFFDQPGFIDEAVAGLAPQRPGITDLYYLGVAGDGFQRVFRREALFGHEVFASRLGTGARSLDLINDVSDRDSFPLGTATGLRYALMRIGEAMDPAEDMVVLFLTSHGSQDGLSLRDGVTPFDSDLAPDEVRSALDDAGIRWRIVIVSACYAGVFVEPLKSDNTMIITAADSRNTSFGCADDRDLTYFGEAFLRDSLPQAPSLAAAFERASEEIARREKQEQLTPSNPQMWVGASMARKLASLGPLPVGAVAAP